LRRKKKSYYSGSPVCAPNSGRTRGSAPTEATRLAQCTTILSASFPGSSPGMHASRLLPPKRAAGMGRNPSKTWRPTGTTSFEFVSSTDAVRGGATSYKMFRRRTPRVTWSMIETPLLPLPQQIQGRLQFLALQQKSRREVNHQSHGNAGVYHDCVPLGQARLPIAVRFEYVKETAHKGRRDRDFGD
jgi:hypothetical protein